MSWRNARDFALLARPFERSKWPLQIRGTSTKSGTSTIGEKMKALRKEENLFYGKLLETKKAKTKRLKLESAGKLTKSVPSAVDSEFAWIQSTTKKLSVITVQPNDVPVVRLEQKCPSEQAKEVEKVRSESQEEKPSGNKLSKSPLLPRVIVQQLLQFPVYEVSKAPKDQWDDNCKVMSLSAMENKACLSYPSVTKILSATMSEEAKDVLEKWRMKMIEKLGLRGFEIYQAELFEDGKLLHSIIMSFLTQKPYDVPNKVKQSFISLEKVLKDVDQVRAIESHVIHSRLLYRGIVDCIANYRGDLCLIDWKKSDKAKNTIGATYDAPLQLASYIGAVNSDPNYPFQIKKGLIIVAYTNGEPAKVHEVTEDSLKMYWKLWLQRLQDYHIALNPS